MSKKFLTRLLNKAYRARVISSMRPEKIAAYKIPQYARYTVDKVILSRDKSHEKDKDWQYGFSPLEVLAYVGTDGKLVTKLFEFNTVNHFLKLTDGDSAVEVVTAILVDWAKNDMRIRDFDIDEIDAGLKKIEDDYAEEEKARRADEDAGRKIKELVGPVMDGMSGMSYADAVAAVERDIRPILEKLVSDKTVSEYEFGYGRNTPSTKEAGEFFLNIGYKARPESETLVLVCAVRPKPKAEEGAGDVAVQEQ